MLVVLLIKQSFSKGRPKSGLFLCLKFEVAMISEKGLSLVRQFEGLRTTAYKCSAGVWTIGYGHTQQVKAGKVITKAQADAFLQLDISKADATIQRLVKVPINQNERDALASFIFNLGAGAFESSTLLKKINEGDKQSAANEFLKWDKFRNPVTKKLETLTGLTKRRVAEKSLFESKAL
jgi:lysozyme